MDGDEIADKLTYDLAKAICFKESSMKEVDLMQVTDEAKKSLEGNIETYKERDWNWSVPPDADGDYPVGDSDSQPFLNYSGITDTTEDASLKWGIRWLYAKKSRGLAGSKPDTLRPVWDNWTTTLENYNGEPDKEQYAIDIMTLYQSGENPHAKEPDYMWPIMTDGMSRKE